MYHLRSLVLYAIIIHLFSIGNIHAQDTNALKYLPLKVGNVWVYYYSYGSPVGQGTSYNKYSITGIIQINGKYFFQVQHVIRIITSYGMFSVLQTRLFENDLPIRIDSLSLNINKSNCNASPESVIDSLKSKINDTATVCGGWQGNRAIYKDSLLYNIFGLGRQSKNFGVFAFEGYNSQRYVKNIGLAEYIFSQHGEGASYSLRGCIIDGIVYGDTGITGINKISSEVPEHFSLYQNYPNPFNPTTKIKFSIPSPSPLERSGVRLVIYDALGREVQTLVNEQLHPGTYEVEWPASNFSSGMYYYTITSDTFTQTKKMVLLK
jgi:hypothetical protein